MARTSRTDHSGVHHCECVPPTKMEAGFESVSHGNLVGVAEEEFLISNGFPENRAFCLIHFGVAQDVGALRIIRAPRVESSEAANICDLHLRN